MNKRTLVPQNAYLGSYFVEWTRTVTFLMQPLTNYVCYMTLLSKSILIVFYNQLLALESNSEINGFVTGSSGNHGLALSWISSQLNPPLPCVVVVVNDCPKNKVDSIQRYGGEVIYCDSINVNSRESKAKSIAKDRNYVYISSCDHRDVIAGQATIGLELLQKVS
jgi:threonine dehydratase